MSTLLYNPYIVKWSTKGEGGLKKTKKLSTWFMNDPLLNIQIWAMMVVFVLPAGTESVVVTGPNIVILFC